MTNATRSDHSGPTREAAPATPPPSVIPMMPAMLTRELALTSPMSAGSNRGTAAARATA